MHVHIQVYTAIQAVEAALASATREIFVCRICGHPFYLPRIFAAALCVQHKRLFPAQKVKAVCSAVRGVARIQMSLYNLFEDGMSQSVTDVLQERFPAEMVPRLAEFSSDSIKARCHCLHSVGSTAPTHAHVSTHLHKRVLPFPSE